MMSGYIKKIDKKSIKTSIWTNKLGKYKDKLLPQY